MSPLLTGDFPKNRLSPLRDRRTVMGFVFSCCLALENAAVAFITVRISRGPDHAICAGEVLNAVLLSEQIRGRTWAESAGGQMAANPENKAAPGVRPDISYQVKSYRYLRMGIVGLLVALGAAVIYQRFGVHCGLGSVSAYFYTPARSVFVGGLVGLGASMIALRGMNLPEEIFLNVGGIFAFLVAFVPTPGGSAACQDPDVRVTASVQDNVTALLIVGGVAIAGAIITLARGWKDVRQDHRPWILVEVIVVLALWTGTLIALLGYLSWAVGHLHVISAISLALCIIAVAGSNAFRPKPDDSGAPAPGQLSKPTRPLYGWIAVGMFVISVLLLILAVTNVISVYWLEIAVAAMFALFWTVQTIQLEHESRTNPPGSEQILAA